MAFDNLYYADKKQKLIQRAEEDKIDFINTILIAADKFKIDFVSISEELKEIDMWVETNKPKVEEIPEGEKVAEKLVIPPKKK